MSESSSSEPTENDKRQKVNRKAIMAIVDQQQRRCALTNWALTPETASLDHIIPLSQGGAHDLLNAQIVDWRVNKAKGSMTNDEFIAMCVAVAQHRGPSGEPV